MKNNEKRKEYENLRKLLLGLLITFKKGCLLL
jgi:hypothetical protein